MIENIEHLEREEQLQVRIEEGYLLQMSKEQER